MKNWKRKTALFLASQGVSLFGSSIVQFAMIWFVTKETASGVIVSLMSVCAFVPQMLISMISGVWADRYPKKWLIMLSDGLIAAATLTLALLMPLFDQSRVLIAALLLTSVIRSIGTGIQQPAVNAFLPELVPAERLMKVNGVNATIQSIVQFVAPAVAGAILTMNTIRSTLYLDVATAAVGIGLLSCIALPRSKRKATASASLLTDWKLGAHDTFSDPFLGKLLMLFGAFIFLCVPAGFLATLFVTRTYGDSYFHMSLVEIIGFVGMMLGGVLIGTWGGFANRMKTLLVGLFSFGVLAIGMGAVRQFVVYLILMAVYGIALTMVQTATTTLIQEKAAPDMQGRVFGFMNTIYSGCLPLGMAVFGPLADVVPLHLLMIGSGIVLALSAVMIAQNRRFYVLGMPPEPEQNRKEENAHVPSGQHLCEGSDAE